MTTGVAAPARPVSLPARAGMSDGLRVTAMAVILLVMLVGANPFHDGTAPENAASGAGGNLGNQILFLIMGTVAGAVLFARGRAALRPLASLPILLMLAWLALSTALSIEPLVSARRLVSLVIMTAAAVALLVAARDARQFATVLGATVLGIVGVSYLGLVLAPERAMHTAFDLIEPEHAGSWRGIYPHKNAAGAAMGAFVFVGLFWAGTGRRGLGFLLAGAAAAFLVFTNAKTSIAITPVVVALTWLCTWSGATLWRRAVLLTPLALLLALTVGSVLVPGIGALVAGLAGDPTFTGRTEIWEFAADNIAKRPLAGYGYGAFWESVFYGGGADAETWVNRATDAHNGYLNTALESGLVGLALTAWWIVWAPVTDLQDRAGGRRLDPLAMLFLRLWLFVILVAVFESVFYQATNGLYFLLVVSVLGLRYLARSRVVAGGEDRS
ncbi:O-antigen ligase family protein [Methylobacterium sp. WL69]|uniref:O-antigen ligase family protein n=1 Tax=Methylobacterium sp. WL69 TaxID=2603893 RepID=UPI0011C8FAC6|nr:O-antigen ligase [Methylobacterium sp. WL69]TXM71808.1 O-antigen ligase family protein [Methylobacterium sp. WL69]